MEKLKCKMKQLRDYQYRKQQPPLGPARPRVFLEPRIWSHRGKVESRQGQGPCRDLGLRQVGLGARALEERNHVGDDTQKEVTLSSPFIPPCNLKKLTIKCT